MLVMFVHLGPLDVVEEAGGDVCSLGVPVSS